MTSSNQNNDISAQMRSFCVVFFFFFSNIAVFKDIIDQAKFITCIIFFNNHLEFYSCMKKSLLHGHAVVMHEASLPEGASLYIPSLYIRVCLRVILPPSRGCPRTSYSVRCITKTCPCNIQRFFEL